MCVGCCTLTQVAVQLEPKLKIHISRYHVDNSLSLLKR